jgi:hypothetical protein
MSFPIGIGGVLIITLIELTHRILYSPTNICDYFYVRSVQGFDGWRWGHKSQLKLNEYGENIHYKKSVAI